MKTLTTPNNESSNAANVASVNNVNAANGRKIEDFGAKIGGARKDMYQAANEWAEQLASVTAEKLAAVGLSKLVRLPNLEKLAAVGAVTNEQARAALVLWRTIERKPTYGAARWAARTRETLEAVAAVLTGGEVPADVAECPEYKVLTAANWPSCPFSFGKYGVKPSYYDRTKLRIIGGRYYYGEGSDNPARIAEQLREMVAADEEKAAGRRAAGPALAIYRNRAGLYFIAPDGKPEICLHTYETAAEASTARREQRPELVARYEALKSFPDCRREWNRPRVGEDWRGGENMTPEKFAALLPFRGVEFGNWVNQTERAALLNSAFDGFFDLAAVLGIDADAVTLRGSLAFAFASRGHSKAAAHYESARRVINLTKKSGAGCMAHEWFHAVDNFAAGGGVQNYATQNRSNAKAYAILEAIKKTDYFKRSQRLAAFKGNNYWVEGCELTARAFEAVCAVLLNAAGICSDFLVNCISIDEFSAKDVAHRSDCYPYPTADEAAALLPLYLAFFREVFGEGVTMPAAALAISEEAAKRAEADRIEAEKLAAERLAAEKAKREEEARKREEEAARKAEENKRNAAAAVAVIVETMTAAHFDTIVTTEDAAAVYAVAHLEGEIYTLSADIKTTAAKGREYVEGLPMFCLTFKRSANAKRIIYKYREIRANKWNARELCESLRETPVKVREICRAYEYNATVETWAKAAKVYADTAKLNAHLMGNTANPAPRQENAASGAPACGLHLEETAEGVRVVGDTWKDTYFNKSAIKANGGKWNKAAKCWEATDAADVARLRSWFALRDGVQTTEAEAVAEDETTAAPTLPEWLTVGAHVRTSGRYMMNGKGRAVWVEGEEMEITAISAEWVEMKSATGCESVSTSTAADVLTPVCSIAASLSTSDEDTSGATYKTSATEEEKAAASSLSFMEKAATLDNVTTRIFAPWGEIGKKWLCPFRGAADVWSEYGKPYGLNDFGRLSDWALTAKVGDTAEYNGLLIAIWERDGQTATEPTTEAERLKANREARERLRAALVAELEGVGAFLYDMPNQEMKIFGKAQDAATLSAVEDIARRYPSAKFMHEKGEAIFEFDLPLFFPHFFPTDPTPDGGGNGDNGSVWRDVFCVSCNGTTYTGGLFTDREKAQEKADALNYIDHRKTFNVEPVSIPAVDYYRLVAEEEEAEKPQVLGAYDAAHYREVLTAEYWGEHEPRKFQFNGGTLEVYKPTSRRPSWLLVEGIFSQPQQMTLDGIADHLAKLYAEEFKEKIKVFAQRFAKGWDGEKFRALYTLETLAVCLLLELEVYYYRTQENEAQTLKYLREAYPQATAEDLRRVYGKFADIVTEIYG